MKPWLEIRAAGAKTMSRFGPSLPSRDVRYHGSFRHKRTSITPKRSAQFVVYGLIFPKSSEPVRRERRVSRGVLDIAVAQVGLQRSRIDAVICQLVTAGVAQHMRVRFDA
jgi:hypothetical protein